MSPMRLGVGTRGSRLSLTQTASVVDSLRDSLPGLQIETKIIRTVGDRIPSRPIPALGVKGVFEREIDLALVRGSVDFAVHSMKDVPAALPPKVAVVAVPERGSPYDALVSRDGLKLMDLPAGTVVGTGSPRREAQLHAIRPDLKVKSIRGNVESRMGKLTQGIYDAIVVGEAGLRRLGMASSITEVLPLRRFTPAPGQGALAVVAREDDKEVVEILKRVNHPPSMAEILAERSFMRAIGGGCAVPLGAIARARGRRLAIYASLVSPDGRQQLRAEGIGALGAPESLGLRLARRMLRAGARCLLESGGEVCGEG